MTWTRREFLTRSVLGLLAAGGVRPRPGRGAGSLVELRRNVGIFSSRGGTIGWLAGPGGSAVVDSQYPDTARLFLAALQERHAPPVAALVNTHHHGDHTAGNGVIGESARAVVAHERVPELQRRAAAAAGSEAAQTYADTTFADAWSLEVGDETVVAKHHGAAHTAGDATVHFQRADVVHMGDLVFHRAYPFVDLAGGASVPGWISVLEAVAAEHTDETIFVFGHSNPARAPTGRRADVLAERDFLTAVLHAAQRAVAAGRSREEATSLQTLPGFEEWAALSPRLTLAAPLGAAYDELTRGG